jgi:hypothetical protein
MVVASDSVHVFRIPAAMGFSSQPAGGFTLKLNGQAVLSFDVVLDDGQWVSADGRVRMTYGVMENNTEDSNGLLEIAVAASLLQPGQSATFEVVGVDRQSQRWFGIYDL